jgi:hypothetical protein
MDNPVQQEQGENGHLQIGELRVKGALEARKCWLLRRGTEGEAASDDAVRCTDLIRKFVYFVGYRTII